MTFYVNDDSTILPDLPSLGYVLDESPYCQQSLKFWEQQTEEVESYLTAFKTWFGYVQTLMIFKCLYKKYFVHVKTNFIFIQK